MIHNINCIDGIVNVDTRTIKFLWKYKDNIYDKDIYHDIKKIYVEIAVWIINIYKVNKFKKFRFQDNKNSFDLRFPDVDYYEIKDILNTHIFSNMIDIYMDDSGRYDYLRQ